MLRLTAYQTEIGARSQVMLSRIISGVVLAVGIVLVLLKSPWWGFGIVIGVAAALGSNEYIRMARPMSGAGERARG